MKNRKGKHFPLMFRACCLAVIFCSLTLLTVWNVFAASPAGYTEYYIPADEENLLRVLEEVGYGGQGNLMHSVITVSAWSDNTTVYYDHWEDGYDFDPDNPGATADEIHTIPFRGDTINFESGNIPANPRGTATYYDGRDRIYVAGGSTTVSRSGWTEDDGTLLSVAWEVYPVRPQLTTYILPFGEDLANPAGANMQDFERVFALIQAPHDNTVVQFDLDGDGIVGDTFCLTRDNPCTTTATQVTLNEGEVFLLDQDVSRPTSATLNTGTVIQANDTIQVQYIIGDEGSNFEIRGLSAFPRGFWDDEYYAPVDSDNGEDYPTDVYLFNPHATPLTINYEVSGGSGTLTIPANSTVSFQQETGNYVPANSALYLKGSDVFWGVSTIDTSGGDNYDFGQGRYADWGYSLVPSFLLQSEFYMGWAPGYYTPSGTDYDASGIFISPVQDNTRVFVDYNGDGNPEQTFDLNRLETQFVYDTGDGDLSGANIWATGPFAVSFGQNSDTAPGATPAIDVGYTTLPGGNFIEKALTVDKTADPVVVPTTAGAQTTFSITVDTYDFDMSGIGIADFLPDGWQYVTGSTTITLADMTQVTGAAADPQIFTETIYGDSFDTGTYSSNGDNVPSGLTWNGNWVEDENNGPANGDIRIVTDGAATALWFDNQNREIARMADLSGVSEPVLSFNYRRDSLEDTGEFLDVEVCENATPGTPITCPGGWQQLGRIDASNNDGTYQNFSSPVSRALSNPSSANFAVRFTTNGSNTYNGYDFFYIDDVEIKSEAKMVWDSTLLGNMAPNQTITIEYTAETTRAFSVGDTTRNVVEASGTRTVGSPLPVTQNFVTSDFAFNVFGEMEIQKTSSATDPVNPGDTLTYTVVAGNPATALNDLTGISIYDFIPAGVTYVPGSSLVSSPNMFQMGETFDYNSYGSNADNLPGSLSWTTDWIEDNDDGDPFGGRVRISNFQLRINRQNRAIARKADLSTFSQAILNFDYLRANVNSADDIVDVEVCENATNGSPIGCNDPGGWTRVFRVQGPTQDSTYQSSQVDLSTVLSNPNSSDFAIRFSSMHSDSNLNRRIFFDNIFIDLGTTGPVNDPPNFVTTDDNFVLHPGENLTLTFDVTVDDPLTTGIDEITNTASLKSNEFPFPEQDSVTNQIVNPTADTGEVGDRIWLDADGDGVLDVGEPGLVGVEVTLRDRFGTPLLVTTTDSTGHYVFTGVAAGNDYYVEVTGGLPAGLQQSAPSGHSDDRTEPFDLVAGQIYSDADIGYASAPGTATLGDLIWNDADGDAFHDPGELGIGSVTVELWFDADDDGRFEPTTDDTLVSTTTTGPDGSYIFPGVPASGTENYYVYADTLQPALAGYTLTTSSNSPGVIDIAADEVVLTLDMGFQAGAGTTYTVTDRVWFDVNGDGQDDGESGIAGVTVDLLDASAFTIASTTTAADGTFSFSGLPGNGADYTIRITDTDGILADYYGTTAAAVANETDIVNLNGDIDFTAEPTEPNFGYNMSGTLGDTVFNDLDGNATQDTGETGLGGVTVRLYLDDGDGVLDGGDTLQATRITDVNGYYLFTGLNDGGYIVSIDSTPAGFSYTTEPVDDDPAAGEQQAVTISGGNNHTDIDFGYQVPVVNTRDVSGTLWRDTNEDGIIDGGEPRFSGVTVELIQGGTIVARSTTDASGNYSFDGLPPGVYTVHVTDDIGMLSGYETVYELSEGSGASSYNNQENVDLTAASLTGINFGFNQPIITRIVLSRFQAMLFGDRVLIEWETASEIRTIGFHILRKNMDGSFQRINTDILPGLIVSPQGGVYRFIDDSGRPFPGVSYALQEVENDGSLHTFGPFTLDPGEANPLKVSSELLNSGYTRTPHPDPERKTKTGRKSLRSGPTAKSGTLNTTTRAARIYTDETGIYSLSVAKLSEILNISERQTKNIVRRGNLSLQLEGEEVGQLTADGNTGLYFYGRRTDDAWSRANVFQVRIGKGVKIGEKKMGAFSATDGLETFSRTTHAEMDNYPVTGLFSDPEADFWMWDFLVAGNPSLGSKTFSASTKAVDTGGGASLLTLRVHGAVNNATNPDHHVRVSINGTIIGDDYFDGMEAKTINIGFDASLLNDGENQVTIEALADTGAPYSMVFIDDFDIRYPSFYQALNGELAFTGDGNDRITVSGFATPDILLFDVTDPKHPVSIDLPRTGNPNDGYSMVIAPETPDTRYFAVERERIPEVSRYDRDVYSTVNLTRERADYLIITDPELYNASYNYAIYRASTGYKCLVVTTDDIMNAYAHGVSTPIAIRDFLSYVYGHWTSVPKFVLLAGAGTLDYNDFQGNGGNLIPPYLVETPDGLFGSDNWLVDVSGDDGIPEMAIGRLPALTEDDIYAYLDKVKAFEQGSGDWTGNVMMLAGKTDPNGNFASDSDDVADVISTSFQIEKVYLSQLDLSTARTRMFSGMEEGRAFVNYIGHGAMDRLDQALLTSTDIPSLTNGSKTPVMTFMTCLSGRFEFPGVESIAELMVARTDGGASAVWSASGLSDNQEAKKMAKELYTQMTVNRVYTLGEAIRNTMEAYMNQGGLRYMAEMYVLIGDPALEIKTPDLFLTRLMVPDGK